jgi:pyruvate/2-oxoglutarate/acetoin dehydrogenase E1 component
MTEKNVVTAIRDALHDEMAADDRVMLLGEDVGNRGGVFRISAGWMEEFGEERVIDTPLAESAIVGVAIGMALHGLLPVAEIQFADFIHPAFNQLVSEAARDELGADVVVGRSARCALPGKAGQHTLVEILGLR